MSAADWIKEKQRILNGLKPHQFNNVKYWIANLILMFAILYSFVFGYLLLLFAIPFYGYLVYGCVDWKEHERNIKW